MNNKKTKTVVIERRHFPFGVFSDFYIDDVKVAVTVERPWKNNERNVSCVPNGEYVIMPHISPSKGECYAIESPTLGVTRYGPSQRTHCLLHVANTPSEVKGCIAPGLEFGCVGQEWGVLNSEAAFKEIKMKLGKNQHKLIIRNHAAM